MASLSQEEQADLASLVRERTGEAWSLPIRAVFSTEYGIVVVESQPKAWETARFQVHCLGCPGARAFSTEFHGPIGEVVSGSRSDHSFPFFEARESGGHGGAFYERLFYAITKDRVVLVRFECSNGKLDRDPRFIMEPGQKEPSPEELLHRLESSDPVFVLETLTYLGSAVDEGWSDLAEEYYRGDVLTAYRAYKKRSRAIRDQEGVQVVLLRLCNSPDPWIREAASAVLHGS